MPTLVNDFTSGARLVLGPITLSRDGIERDGKSHAWDEIGAPAVSRHAVTVETTAGLRLELDARKVPSLPSLDDYGVTALTALVVMGRSRYRKG